MAMQNRRVRGLGEWARVTLQGRGTQVSWSSLELGGRCSHGNSMTT